MASAIWRTSAQHAWQRSVSRDAKYYVHTYARLLSDLYVVDGLK